MTTEIPFYTQAKADELLAAKADTAALGDASTHPASDFATAAQGATADTALQPADVGSAAGHPATDFATSAQGGKADTAVQPARQVTAGTGLSGGGDLSADRTLAVQFGTTAGTVAQGNDSRIVGAAPLASPAFTGNPTAPTPAAGDNDTSIATTAFVQGAKVAAFFNTAAVDLNTYLTPGTFFMSTLASGAGSANFPSQFAGMLRVTGAAGFYVQEYITVRDLYPRAPLTYTRYYDGAWTPWVVGRNSLPLTGNTITGTGSPQGLVAAPVGTTYIDTAATLGAAEWTKMSGVGNTGWSVTMGDTGIQSIATWDNTGAVTKGALPAGWVPRAGQAGSVLVRRTNSLVTVRIRNIAVAVAASGDRIWTAATGYLPDNVTAETDCHMWSSTDTYKPFALSANLSRGSNFPTAVGDYIVSTQISYVALDSWPTAAL